MTHTVQVDIIQMIYLIYFPLCGINKLNLIQEEHEKQEES